MLLVHPVNGYVTVNHIPAMTMCTWRMSCRFEGIVPNAGLLICSCDMVLESIFGWRQIAGLCILSAEQFVPNSVRVFAVVSVQWAYKLSTSFPPFVVVAEWITNHHHGSAHVWVGLDRNRTPAFSLFPRRHLCCHIRLTHTFHAMICTHLHQVIVQWQSCQGTSFVASYRYRIASWH